MGNLIQKSNRIVLLLLACGLTACKKQEQAAAVPPPPVVTVTPVEQEEIIEWDEFTGRTEAVEFVEVRPRVSGHIEQVKFQAGQTVAKGDVLFVIDSRWYQAEFDQKQAAFQQAKVRLETAEREAGRTEKLLANKAISTEEAETRQSRFSEAKAGVIAAEAALSTVKLDLEYTQVRSPIAGRVSRAMVTEGNYISGMAGNATLLTTIVSVDPIYVYADVDENSLLKFNSLVADKKVASNGDGKVPVELQLADETGFKSKGHIESFDNRLNPQSGSILLRAVFPNADGRIVPGLFARIRVPGSAKYPALLVDEKAIGTDQSQKFVLTITATNTAEYRAVKLGPTIKGKRVVRSGLKAGDQVVVNGLQRVRPGMPVNPQSSTVSNAVASATPNKNGDVQ